MIAEEEPRRQQPLPNPGAGLRQVDQIIRLGSSGLYRNDSREGRCEESTLMPSNY